MDRLKSIAYNLYLSMIQYNRPGVNPGILFLIQTRCCIFLTCITAPLRNT